jgi:hypothetical protein
MIEINRRLYMDEETGERLPSFDEMRRTVCGMSVAGRHPQWVQ